MKQRNVFTEQNAFTLAQRRKFISFACFLTIFVIPVSAQERQTVDCVKEPENSLCPRAEPEEEQQAPTSAPLHSKHALPTQPQTTIFGITLGRPMPEDAWVGSLIDNSYSRSSEEDVGGNVGQLEAWFVLAVCPRVLPALEAKFGKPQTMRKVPSRSGLGVNVTVTRLTWNRKNGDTIMFEDPSFETDLCGVHAWTRRYAAEQQKAKKDDL